MNCTAFGLMVAIPLVLVHSLLQTKTATTRRRPRDGVGEDREHDHRPRGHYARPLSAPALPRSRVGASRAAARLSLTSGRWQSNGEGHSMEVTVRSARIARHLHKRRERRDQPHVDDRHDDDPGVLPARARRFRQARDARAEPAGVAVRSRAPEPPTFELEIMVRESAIEVGDRSAGLLSRIEKTRRRLRLRAAHGVPARSSSSSSPTRADATLLLEPDISVRRRWSRSWTRFASPSSWTRTPNRVTASSCFPQISVGDAPL